MTMRRRWLGAVLAAALVACARREPAGCEPASTEACPCPGGEPGVRVCGGDGRFGRCACPSAAPAFPFEPPRVQPLIVPPASVAAAAPPRPLTPAAPAPPAGGSPMDRARRCLREHPRDMAAGNQCVLGELRGRASTESELGLLAVTYRTMGRPADAMRTMRAYIRSHPDGLRVASFQQYIDNNAP